VTHEVVRVVRNDNLFIRDFCGLEGLNAIHRLTYPNVAVVIAMDE